MMRSGSRSAPVALLLAAGAALALAGSAAADKEKIRLTPAGNAAAHAVLVMRTDLGTAAGWAGGSAKPDLTSTLPCSYQPKQSDLVLIGAAKTVWKNTGIEFDSEAQVLQTPAMVGLDWQRSVLAPQVVPCLRAGIAKQLGSTGRLVSFRRVGFPRIATYARKYRALVDVNTAAAPVRIMVDVVMVGRGRTEITLTTSASYAASATVSPAELRLAILLVSRIRS
jgi:hypothetical protein